MRIGQQVTVMSNMYRLGELMLHPTVNEKQKFYDSLSRAECKAIRFLAMTMYGGWEHLHSELCHPKSLDKCLRRPCKEWLLLDSKDAQDELF